MRAQVKAKEDPKGAIAGALEEAKLIEWPSLTKALTDTAIVIAVVIGTSGGLFALNTLLAELSREVYAK
jgi:preprotein translocase SecE subunit